MGIAAASTGIDKIPVKKEDLLKRLKENKGKHETEFKEAFQGYQKTWLKGALKTKRDAEDAHKKSMKRLDKAIMAAQRSIETDDGLGKLTKFPTHIHGVSRRLESPPSCFSEDYALALDLFEMFQPMDTERPGVIDLSPSDFAHYCRDDWGWKQEHRESVANYGGPQGPVGPAGPAGSAGPMIHDLDWDTDEDEED